MPGGPTTPAPAPDATTPGRPGPPQSITTTGGDGYSVDVERAPQAIADLRRTAKALWDEAKNSWNLADITPPGLDVVSANAVQVFVETAVGEHGSLRMALEGAARRCEEDADKLEASLKTYLQVDEISLPPPRVLRFEGPR
ncbi:MAG TPA: hypothetical protein VFQ77_12000 [Pseudonocardiaceae bacterium]|jgi:hypothetical protein|nr:hypothetical protein [Pseudonocardiaceae bacterium]